MITPKQEEHNRKVKSKIRQRDLEIKRINDHNHKCSKEKNIKDMIMCYPLPIIDVIYI